MKRWFKSPHFIAFLLWAGPGAWLSWVLRDSVPWVTVLSWYAIVVTHLAGFSSYLAKKEVRDAR